MMNAGTQVRAEPYLHFVVGGEHYAAPSARVAEVVPEAHVEPVRDAPPHVRGVLVQEGHPVPVVDLSRLLGQALRTVKARPTVVVAQVQCCGEPLRLGLAVDGVGGPLELSSRDVVPAPSFGAAVPVDFLVGMGRHGEGLVLLMDVERVLSEPQLHTALKLVSGSGPSHRS
ncbi:purine-binding chemotaxis protein CheW [Pyxidicoccus fallax]|uniref:Purine-binding chemotaxis protein CheW n=1 Tax=Pyxidicoccus fallax TaxID=394095 RepID=A0A848LMB0_9BACT|nr:chemotaxis protein CheW [Pyxidicoccus fallax]NMO18851.1 purine-binding chemotaxis protein CheW [Pyxidicoccus fallax]NPC81958.1 purine-binding chemotaxis protein CheW [Pyxidicoccus fallax]